MKLEIERRFVEAIVGAFPRLASWREQLRLGRKIEVPYDLLSAEELTLDAFRRCAMFRGMERGSVDAATGSVHTRPPAQ
jgi:hypothetical protein